MSAESPKETPWEKFEILNSKFAISLNAVGIGWMIGVGVYLVMNLLRALRANIWLARKRQALSAKLQADIKDLLCTYGFKKFPRIYLMDDISQPFVWGLLRGSIYLPADFVKVNNAEHQRSILGHELSHILRFDAAVNILQVIAQAIFWFHPFVWWANKKIRQEREKCCDEMAIARLNALPKDYSTAILDILAAKRESTRPVPSLAVAGPVKNIEERIKTMLRPGKKFYKHPSLIAATIVLLLEVLTVPTAIVLTVRAENQTSTRGTDADLVFSNPANLGPTVNSSSDEYDPSISADELELYFNSYRPGGLGQADLWVTTRKTKADLWGSPVNLGPTVNSPAGDKAPCISADGLSLYFSSGRSGGHGDLDLWVTTRKTKSGPWGQPVNLGPTVNSEAGEHSPSISTDGLTLYFAEMSEKLERPGGSGGGDIWVTTRKTKRDPWGTPVNLGPTVNSSAWDQAPSISDDGLSLYFDSERSGVDESAIWVTKRKSTSDPWGTPVKLGPAVNADWEADPDISRDGSTLYFASSRQGGVGSSDIWQATLGKRSEGTPDSKAESKLATSLHEAAAAGDIEKVKSLISKGVDVNAKNEFVQTPLHLAARYGHMNVVEVLIANGANIQDVDKYGNMPLHYAVESDRTDVAEMLIDKGANINSKNSRGWTVLHFVAEDCWDNLNMAQLLIVKGADINAEDNYKATPLDMARWNYHGPLVEFLVARGAKLDAHKQTDLWKPIHSAARYGQKDKVQLLIDKGTDVNAKDAAGYTPLHHAAEQGHKEVCELLIAKGADVNAKDAEGWRPLHRSAAGGHMAVVELLLDKGARLNAGNKWGEPPLRSAAEGGQKDVAELLIAKGSDVNAKWGDDWTALHYAAYGGAKDLTELLIDKGANINAMDVEQNTPLHLATRYAREDIAVAKLLIDRGANINVKNTRGLTPLHYASMGRFNDLVKLLIAKGAEVNAKDNSGMTALHYASGNNQKDSVELLIANGAELNAEDIVGAIPLHRSQKDTAEILLAKGTNINSKDYWGSTPLHTASEDGRKAVVELFIAKGADVNVKNRRGETPLSLAKKKEHAEIVELLRKHGAKE